MRISTFSASPMLNPFHPQPQQVLFAGQGQDTTTPRTSLFQLRSPAERYSGRYKNSEGGYYHFTVGNAVMSGVKTLKPLTQQQHEKLLKMGERLLPFHENEQLFYSRRGLKAVGFALDQLNKVVGNDPMAEPNKMEYLMTQGGIHQSLKEYPQALESFEKALATLKGTTNPQMKKPTYLAEVYFCIGELHSEQPAPKPDDLALEAYMNAYEALDKAPKRQKNPLLMANILVASAEVLQAQNNDERAMEMLSKLLAMPQDILLTPEVCTRLTMCLPRYREHLHKMLPIPPVVTPSPETEDLKPLTS